MHLSYSTSKYKGKTYKSYSLAESYRDGNKVKKRRLCKIGKLTDRQAEQIKLICKVSKNREQIVCQLDNLVVKESKSYLDISIVNELWKKWKLDSAFEFNITDSELSTHHIAKILTINRCTDPCSHYSVPQWARGTALADVLDMDLSNLNDDKIYYELDKISQNKVLIENHLFKQTFSDSPESYEFINYDLSTSYFVGYKCALSAFGKGKIECHGRRQVLLGVLINDQGYPFKWDVFPGNKAEVKTLKQNIDACMKRFKLSGKNVTIVFDRGIISDDNASMINNAEMKYISALDRNQITPSGVNLEVFRDLTINGLTKNDTIPKGFKKFDDYQYYYDTGIINKKRLVTGFNQALFKEDRTNRDEKMVFFSDFVKNLNNNLKNAKKDRKKDAQKNRIENELKRLKLKRFYEDPIYHPILVKRTLKDGTKKGIQSFKVEISKKIDAIASDKLLDGVCVFVTNHTERQGRGFKIKPHEIIKAYRDKTKVEDVFKNVKSFLKLRPFFVNTASHVKAVYTICMLAYFINRHLANKRKELGEKDYLNSRELYTPFKNIDYVSLEDGATGHTIKKSVELPEKTKDLLVNLGLAHILSSPRK